MKVKFYHWYNAVLSALLTMLGFGVGRVEVHAQGGGAGEEGALHFLWAIFARTTARTPPSNMARPTQTISSRAV